MQQFKRHQRLRKNQAIRDLLAETALTKKDLVMPVFIHEGLKKPKAIKSLPGIFQHGLSSLPKEIERIQNTGVTAVILFGIPKAKDQAGSSAYDPDGIIQQSIRLIKSKFPDMIVIADCCLCEYTSHGHCGIITDQGLDNDTTLYLLGKTAVTYALAGADIIAPSGMMDGMVTFIRENLDKQQFKNTLIMSYAVKYASSFYGPFRDAAGSGQFKGDRKHHQMNPTQIREAISEAEEDIRQGADILMVKPALVYLDIIKTLHDKFTTPLAAYQVSGEYAMVKAAAAAGLVDEQDIFLEQMIGFKRAGAGTIVSYAATEIAPII